MKARCFEAKVPRLSEGGYLRRNSGSRRNRASELVITEPFHFAEKHELQVFPVTTRRKIASWQKINAGINNYRRNNVENTVRYGSCRAQRFDQYTAPR